MQFLWEGVMNRPRALPLVVCFDESERRNSRLCYVCVLLLQDLLQSCARGGRRRVEDMCYERRRAEACVDESAQHALGPVRNPVL
jgi:hypothetical protein